MQTGEQVMKSLDQTIATADAAGVLYEQARQALARMREHKYEVSQSPAGDVLYIPIAAILEKMKADAVEGGKFTSAINGRSTKEERAAELDAWMLKNDKGYADYVARMQTQEVQEAMARAAAEIAESDYGRAHTKVMALRGELEFITETARVEAMREEGKNQSVRQTFDLKLAADQNVSAERLETMRMQRVEKEIELAKIQAETATKELEAAQVNMRKEVANAEAVLAEYKQSVMPLLQLAESVRALTMPAR